MRRPIARFAGLVTVALVAGCAAEAEAPKPSFPVASPHGGQLVMLPDGHGLAELIIGPLDAARPGSKGPVSRITAYFLKADGSGPISPPPSDVKLAIETADGSKLVELRPATDSRDVAFVSESGPFGHDLSGELSVRVGGRDVRATLVVR